MIGWFQSPPQATNFMAAGYITCCTQKLHIIAFLLYAGSYHTHDKFKPTDPPPLRTDSHSLLTHTRQNRPSRPCRRMASGQSGDSNTAPQTSAPPAAPQIMSPSSSHPVPSPTPVSPFPTMVVAQHGTYSFSASGNPSRR